MDTEGYHKELASRSHSYEQCKLHYCCEYDDMPVCKCMIESMYCYCFVGDKLIYHSEKHDIRGVNGRGIV